MVWYASVNSSNVISWPTCMARGGNLQRRLRPHWCQYLQVLMLSVFYIREHIWGLKLIIGHILYGDYNYAPFHRLQVIFHVISNYLASLWHVFLAIPEESDAFKLSFIVNYMKLLYHHCQICIKLMIFNAVFIEHLEFQTTIIYWCETTWSRNNLQVII